MGASVIERMMHTRPLRAAALIAPVPPAGLLPVARRLLAWQPEVLVNLQRLDAPHLSGDVLAALRPMFFSDDVAPDILAQAVMHIAAESPRAILDLVLRLHDGKSAAKIEPFVLGASEDRIATPQDVNATARLHGVKATILPGLAHMMMLDRQWKRAAQPLADWLETID
jgi:pimeloyl-ACP methyl ester carboxylesterase